MRDFDPYGLGWRAGRWYAVGHCPLRKGLRSFRLDRVEEVRMLVGFAVRSPAALRAAVHECGERPLACAKT